MNKIQILAISLLSCFAPVRAEIVTSMPGDLQSILEGKLTNNLTIDGSINASDIEYIAREYPDLDLLDMSHATIVAYEGSTLSSGRTTSPANVLPEYSLAGTHINSIVLPNSLTAVGQGALAASSVSSVTIPGGVKIIEAAAFDGCTNLEQIVLPESVTSIGNLAFKGCSHLAWVIMNDGITSIGASAFDSCTSLELLTLPSSLETIGNGAFNNCSALVDVAFGQSLITIGADAFNGTAIGTIDLSECDKLTSIGSWAFAHNGMLENVILPEDLTTTGDGLFFDCKSLTSVTMPATLTVIAPYMFKGTALTTLKDILGDKVTELGTYALYGVDKVTEAKLPADIQSIGTSAMARMSSLVVLDATAIKSLPELGDDVFEDTSGNDVTLFVTPEMENDFKTTDQWKEFKIVVDDGLSTGIVAPVANDEKLLIKRDGDILSIKSTETMSMVTLFDASGRLLSRTVCNGNTQADVPVGNITSKLIMVVVTYHNNHNVAIKTIL